MRCFRRAPVRAHGTPVPYGALPRSGGKDRSDGAPDG